MSKLTDEAYVEAQTRKLNAEAQILENSAEHLNLERIQYAFEELMQILDGITEFNRMNADGCDLTPAVKNIEKIWDSLLNQ